MRKRVKIVLAIVGIALVGVVVWQVSQPREPEPVYQAKPLSGWLKRYVNNTTSSDDPQLLKVNEAVRQAGTNAIPTLLRLLRSHDSALKLKLLNVAKKQHLIKIKFIPVEAWNFAGVHGFRLLGTNAQSAVPALIEIANQNISRESQRDAIMALGYIGPPSKEAVPSLLRFATNADREVRDVTMFALGRTHAEADRVVPVLINALHDPKFGVREGAVVALGLFGPDAKAAGPALVKYLNSAEEFYRPPITNALKAIDPVAAAKAGVK